MTRQQRSALTALVQQFPDHQLRCRVTNHWWEPHTATSIKNGFETVEICANCGTQRWRLLNRHAEVIVSRLRYAQGYLLRGVGRAHDVKDAARLAHVQRLLSPAKPRR